jgi:hypothetical protein
MVLSSVIGAVTLGCYNYGTGNVVFSPDNTYVIINLNYTEDGVEAKYSCKKCQKEHTIYWTKVEKI